MSATSSVSCGATPHLTTLFANVVSLEQVKWLNVLSMCSLVVSLPLFYGLLAVSVEEEAIVHTA